MPSIAGRSPKRALRFSFRTLVVAVVPQLRASAGDVLAARALADAGLAAVLGIPILLLASLVLDAPLAVPAAIASGYLAISHALASDRPRSAAFISGLVLSALVGWLILYLAEGDEPLSRSGVTAAFLAPLFAAAPAFARSLIAPRAAIVENAVLPSRAAALQRIACLDDLAPSETVLIVDREGCVLAATRAARQRLRLLPDAFEHHVASLFEPIDTPEILDALRKCGKRGETVEIALEGAGEGSAGEACIVVSPCEGGAVSLRLSDGALAEPGAPEAAPVGDDAGADRPIGGAAEPTPFACDIGEAIAFALRYARPRAEERGMALTSEPEAGIRVACDRQIGRRIAHLAIDAALAVSRAGGTIRVDARKLKGIVLLRVTGDVATEEAGFEANEPNELTTLRALVDGAGGTLVVDRRADRLMLSVRLDLADVAIVEPRIGERVEAA